MLDNQVGKKVQPLNLMLTKYKLLAKHLLALENFKLDIDSLIANSWC